jgi:hypothetical protein
VAVTVAAWIWTVCGIIGLALNGLLLLGWDSEEAARLSARGVGLLLILVVGTALFYTGLLLAGRAFRMRRWNSVDLPAAMVLLAALGLVVCNAILVAAFKASADHQWRSLDANLARRGELPSYTWVSLLVGEHISAALALVDVLLVGASIVLLWHSAGYSWGVVRRTPEQIAGSRDNPFPPGIRTAGYLWIVIGMISVVHAAVLGTSATQQPRADNWRQEVVWVIALDGFVLPLLTCVLFGVLLLNARLASTLPLGSVALVLAVLGLVSIVYVFLQLQQVRMNSMRTVREEVDRSQFLLALLWLALHALQYALAVVASLRCIAANASYRDWVRQAHEPRPGEPESVVALP